MFSGDYVLKLRNYKKVRKIVQGITYKNQEFNKKYVMFSGDYVLKSRNYKKVRKIVQGITY